MIKDKLTPSVNVINMPEVHFLLKKHYLCVMKTINLEIVENSKSLAYHDKDIAVITDLADKHFAHEKVLVDGFIVTMVRKGDAKINLDGIHLHLQTGDLFICSPRNVIESAVVSPDIQIIGTFMSRAYAARILDRTDLDIIRMMITTRHHVTHLTPTEQQIYNDMVIMLADLLHMPEAPHKDKTISCFIQTMTYVMSDFQAHIDRQNEHPIATSSAEQIVKKFLNLLTSPSVTFRPVHEYADMLNVTPKYFSTMCKSVTGKTAGTMINEMRVREAKILLRNPKYNIKQIADRLGFANQSHFGSFMRRNTGLSPQELRTSKSKS